MQVFVCLYACMHVCMYICMYVCMCAYVCFCVCMCVIPSCRVCVVVRGRTSVCVRPFSCAGIIVHTVSNCGLGGKSPPLPSLRERQCALRPHSILFRPLRASIARGPAELIPPRILLPVMFTRASSKDFLSLLLSDRVFHPLRDLEHLSASWSRVRMETNTLSTRNLTTTELDPLSRLKNRLFILLLLLLRVLVLLLLLPHWLLERTHHAISARRG